MVRIPDLRMCGCLLRNFEKHNSKVPSITKATIWHSKQVRHARGHSKVGGFMRHRSDALTLLRRRRDDGDDNTTTTTQRHDDDDTTTLRRRHYDEDDTMPTTTTLRH